MLRHDDELLNLLEVSGVSDCVTKAGSYGLVDLRYSLVAFNHRFMKLDKYFRGRHKLL